MGRLFGTKDGPFGDQRGRQETELEMDALVEVLRHDNYQIISERRVAGSDVPSNRIGVDSLMPNGGAVRDVGFTVVFASSNRSLILRYRGPEDHGRRGGVAGVTSELEEVWAAG